MALNNVSTNTAMADVVVVPNTWFSRTGIFTGETGLSSWEPDYALHSKEFWQFFPIYTGKSDMKAPTDEMAVNYVRLLCVTNWGVSALKFFDSDTLCDPKLLRGVIHEQKAHGYQLFVALNMVLPPGVYSLFNDRDDISSRELVASLLLPADSSLVKKLAKREDLDFGKLMLLRFVAPVLPKFHAEIELREDAPRKDAQAFEREGDRPAGAFPDLSLLF
jgi:hypothetical protein